MRRRDVLQLGAHAVGGLALSQTAGCATVCELLGRLAPRLAVQGMEVLEASLSRLSVRFHTVLANPHPIGFHLAGFDYALKLAGGRVANGTAKKGVTLKPRGRSDVPLDLEFDIARTAQAILDMLERNAVEYGLDLVGRFSVPRTRESLEIPTRFQGKMPMPKLPKVDIRGFEVTNASTSTVGFRIDTKVTNRNAFDLPIDGIRFDVKLGGRRVLENKASRGAKINGGKSQIVPFEFRVGLPAIGLTIAELAGNPRLPWEVKSELKSGKVEIPFTQKGSVRL